VLHFSGYDWTVRAARSDHGGEPNAYDPANVWTDEKGYLHLRMAERSGRWTCAELSLDRSFGYGTYKFVVQDSAHLSPSAVLGIFTWDDKLSEDNRNEVDIELSRWGVPNGKNAQYVVQPFYAPDNLARFTVVPAGVMTHTFRWEPGKVSFRTFRDSSTEATEGCCQRACFYPRVFPLLRTRRYISISTTSITPITSHNDLWRS